MFVACPLADNTPIIDLNNGSRESTPTECKSCFNGSSHRDRNMECPGIPGSTAAALAANCAGQRSASNSKGAPAPLFPNAPTQMRP
eukprot:4362996-Lingulodinium_polyedra.AAC.1